MASHHHLYLIRHLPTAGNREKKYIGWTDEPIEPVEDRVSETPIPERNGFVYGSDLIARKGKLRR